MVFLFANGCTKVTYRFAEPSIEPKTIEEYKNYKAYSSEEAIARFRDRISSDKPKELDGPIIPIDVTLPGYPHKMIYKGIEGIVEVYFLVDENGQVEEAQILKSAHPDLDAHCLKAIKKWRFKPMTSGGKPVKVKLFQRIVFDNENG